MSELPAILLGAYRRSVYRVGSVEVRVGKRSAAMDALLQQKSAREGVLVAAWNPFSRRMPEAWNRRMDARLRERLRRHRWQAASGGFGRWWEEHVLILGAPRPALVLARRFRQRAVVVLRRGQRVRLVVVR